MPDWGMSKKATFTIATWNINSVRLRIESVVRLLKEHAPDVLCLQETKCPQGQFPSSPLKELGYGHIAEFGQKGYHGVAIVSRLPFASSFSKSFCGKDDCRHIATVFERPSAFVLHNYYVPAGGDEPDISINEKFDHKLKFLAEMKAWSKHDALQSQPNAIVVGDLNIAPLEHDVWSSKDLKKVVSHTPVEREAMLDIMAEGQWQDVMRRHVPANEKLYTWWSYRAKDWALANRGRRLDHVWATPELAAKSQGIKIVKETRGWTQPSDHVPVLATFAV
jgi:exodeoxyribonuclease III